MAAATLARWTRKGHGALTAAHNCLPAARDILAPPESQGRGALTTSGEQTPHRDKQ